MRKTKVEVECVTVDSIAIIYRVAATMLCLFYTRLDTKWVISDMPFPANLWLVLRKN